MLSTLQIVLLSISGALALASIVFMVMFIVEITVEHKEKDEEEVQSVFSQQNIIVNVEEKKEANVDEMLAKLEEDTKEESIVEPEVVEEVKEEIVEPAQEEIAVVEEPEVIVEEKKEETPVVTNVIINNFVPKEETPVEELANVDDADDEEDDDAEDGEMELLSDLNELKHESHEITASNVIDYKTRLDKIIETRNKIDRDLSKIQKAILKYERTKRRKNRNQKMLDRRAGELTNLNLVMYSVTDIKNVDEDKKAKQEELTAHIAELKASIQDADEYIESNKEKNDHNVKMAKFLLQEKSRYNEEIAELQALIKATEDSATA